MSRTAEQSGVAVAPLLCHSIGCSPEAVSYSISRIAEQLGVAVAPSLCRSIGRSAEAVSYSITHALVSPLT